MNSATEQKSSVVDETARRIREELGVIEMDVLTNTTLADAVRGGSECSEQEYGWGNGDRMCAWSAAGAWARAQGLA